MLCSGYFRYFIDVFERYANKQISMKVKKQNALIYLTFLKYVVYKFVFILKVHDGTVSVYVADTHTVTS